MKDKEKGDFLIVGKVLTTFGVKGQVKVLPQTDYPERIGEIKRLFCRLEDGTFLELHPVNLQVRSETLVVVKFKEFNSPEAAAVLRGCLLEIPREEIRPLEPGHYYYADLVGIEAVSTDGTPIGKVEDVYEAG
ncbi:MAG TPA: ribosome maturation factor RimM, partial [Chroococcales cyanobacterium]